MAAISAHLEIGQGAMNRYVRKLPCIDLDEDAAVPSGDAAASGNTSAALALCDACVVGDASGGAAEVAEPKPKRARAKRGERTPIANGAHKSKPTAEPNAAPKATPKATPKINDHNCGQLDPRL